MNTRHGISVALLRPLAELLGRLDADAAAFLAALGVDDAMAPNVYVPGAAVDRELAAIAVARADPAFALTLARAASVRPLGLFGHLVWLSGTVRDALARAAKFYALVTPRTTLVLDEPPGEIARIQQRPVPGIGSRGRILTEFPFAAFALRGRDATAGRFALRAVRFMHAGEATPAYTEVFRAPVTFGATIDELELDRSQLELPLAGADPITSAALEAQVAQLTSAGAERSPFVDQVRRAVAANLGGSVAPAVVARALGISTRTLRRRLDDDGHALRAVVESVRRERADQMLAAGVPVKEIGFALGFSEPSAFSRAYKRWTGATPRRPKVPPR